MNLFLGVLLTVILSLARTGGGQTAKPGGRISGHVYRSDTHTALAQVTIILQVAIGDVASVQTVQTGADGGYSFNNLDANYYTVVVWKTGFVGRCLQNVQIAGDSLLGNTDFSLPPEPQIAQMADATLSAAHPNLRRNLGFDYGRFSPDGSGFAFAVNGIRTGVGGADETWLYNIRNKRLQRVTDRAGPYVWDADGKLYAWFVNNRKIYVVATPDSISEIDQPPADIASTLERGWQFRSAVQRAGNYEISAENQGHGLLHLYVRSPGEPRPEAIADGGWDLESFLVNPAREQVIYPEGGWFGSIVTYKLRTGQSVKLQIQSGGNIRLLDLTRDGKLLAYSVTGPCSSETGYQWLLQVERLQHTGSNICFLRLK